MSTPKISIVTPCYNHAEYLAETMESVLGQAYPNLEYIVMDGGSTDGSADIIQRHERGLAYWQSAPDTGMYNAINQGMARATGDILGWLNADDFYLPGTLRFVAAQLNLDIPEVVFGNAFHFVEGRAEQWGSDVEREHARKDLFKYDYIIQPASFWTRRTWEQTGTLDESFQVVADWDWFARAKRSGVVFKPRARYLAVYRIVRTAKTQSGGAERHTEQARLLRAYVGEVYSQVFQQVSQQRDAILSIRRALRRIHLTRLEKVVFPVRFPGIFGRVPISEVWDMIETVGYA